MNMTCVRSARYTLELNEEEFAVLAAVIATASSDVIIADMKEASSGVNAAERFHRVFGDQPSVIAVAKIVYALHNEFRGK
jgi:hypothetical protein